MTHLRTLWLMALMSFFIVSAKTNMQAQAKGWGFGIDASYRVQHITGVDRTTAGAGLGLLAQYSFSEKLSLQMGAHTEMLTRRTELTDGMGNLISGHKSTDFYMSIPLMAGLRLAGGERFGIWMQAGAALRFPFVSYISMKGTLADGTVVESGLVRSTPDKLYLDPTVLAGPMVSYRISDRFDLQFYTNASYGFRKWFIDGHAISAGAGLRLLYRPGAGE